MFESVKLYCLTSSSGCVPYNVKYNLPIILRNENASILSKVDSDFPTLVGFVPLVNTHANIQQAS